MTECVIQDLRVQALKIKPLPLEMKDSCALRTAVNQNQISHSLLFAGSGPFSQEGWGRQQVNGSVLGFLLWIDMEKANTTQLLPQHGAWNEVSRQVLPCSGSASARTAASAFTFHSGQIHCKFVLLIRKSPIKVMRL